MNIRVGWCQRGDIFAGRRSKFKTPLPEVDTTERDLERTMTAPSNTPEGMLPGNPQATRLQGQVIVVVLELRDHDWEKYPLPRVVHLGGAWAAPLLPILALGVKESNHNPGLGNPLKPIGFIGVMDNGVGPILVDLDAQQAAAVLATLDP